jgi:hypothetical protein
VRKIARIRAATLEMGYSEYIAHLITQDARNAENDHENEPDELDNLRPTA